MAHITDIGGTDRFDVVVLGDHLATALLAAILGRHGVRVALVSTGTDRELPAGETTVPYTAELFALLGQRFAVPEIADMAIFDSLPEHVRDRCGAKRNLGFLYHRAGTTHDPREALQFTVPGEHAEWHLYRPAVEEHAAGVALKYGVARYASVPVPGGVRVRGSGVEVRLADGRRLTGEYLVDGSADASVLPAGVAGPDPSASRHRARLLHTRMADVRPFESVVPLRRYRKAGPWSQGTLTHAFDGGWIQVAPYGDGTCGVTVSLDPARYPESRYADTPLAPEQEFHHLVDGFPELREQFARARAVRPWREYPHWPAIAPHLAGPRWLLFDRAAGRQDLLLSRDVTMSLELVHATAAALLRTADAGDWADSAAVRVAADHQRQLFDCHDRFVAAARTATRDFALWNAFLRVWLLWTILSALSLKRARLDGERAADWAGVERFDRGEYWYDVPAGLPELLDGVLADLEGVATGLAPAAAAEDTFHRLRHGRFVPPLYRFGDPDARYYRFTRMRRLRMLVWTKTTAPPDFRRLLTVENVTAGAESRDVAARSQAAA
jgi:FADH2 O2-dependent halogenase